MRENPSGLDNGLVENDLEDFADLPEPTQDRLLRYAHRTVRRLAPPPDLADDEYPEAARDAEVAVIQFMIATEGGVLKSSGLSGVSTDSYAGLDAIQRMVASAMGSYYVGEEATPRPDGTGGGATVHNIAPEPLF
ncbi:hypothetical protein GBA65_14930 [Rubrobacter marinus]|uniref:Uncharacterized protein n=1 Tax=Rubrobacter marinus TaxID=2653852 RepID=A0A6G8PZG0_9ACTN|nr:hypothetical protein [Rubrobacter marinus]QIN79601.1 hypothetical protein GBA65_14930 [Rubrobacter marinus]